MQTRGNPIKQVIQFHVFKTRPGSRWFIVMVLGFKKMAAPTCSTVNINFLLIILTAINFLHPSVLNYYTNWRSIYHVIQDFTFFSKTLYRHFTCISGRVLPFVMISLLLQDETAYIPLICREGKTIKKYVPFMHILIKCFKINTI